ncbi:MAG: phage virion morphogenesis protein [Bdellovibrionota bacterium]
MRFEFSEITVPAIPNKLEGAKFEQFKGSMSAVMFSQRLEVFNAQASRDGPWKPLSQHQAQNRTAKLEHVSEFRQKQLAGKGYQKIKILQDKGTLRQSFTPEMGPGNSFKHVELGEDFVRNSTNVEYARIQNQGGSILHPGTENGFGRKIKIQPYLITIPARPFDQFTDENEKELAELTELYLNGQL